MKLQRDLAAAALNEAECAHPEMDAELNGMNAPVYNYDVSNNDSWAGALPKEQGLYNPDFEKDACGVGFVCQIRGLRSHKIVTDARLLLCNMTHRGATGADTRDGDGAGVMTSMPHEFMAKEFKQSLNVTIPASGRYAVGNVFFSPEEDIRKAAIEEFTNIAEEAGLAILGWRSVPCDNTILGPAALSREPVILQPCVIHKAMHDGAQEFDSAVFDRQLFILRKRSTHRIGMQKWFYICSLNRETIVYKGQLAPVQVYNYFLDLNNAEYNAHFALVHSRFSTNTFPSWDRAQPMRFAAHNGEINTLRGNKNWMRAREGIMKSELFGDELQSLLPTIEKGGSDSAAFDNVLELLCLSGTLSLPEAVMLLIPEAWQTNPNISDEKSAFYEWAACQMEPWDGPALFTFADGRYCGANLDRNGLRPCRYYLTSNDIMVCASEVGTIGIDPEVVTQKGRLYPGRMLLVDTKEGRVVDDKELKHTISTRYDFRSWLDSELINMNSLVDALEDSSEVDITPEVDNTGLAEDKRLLAFGYTLEQVNMIIGPMASEGKETLGSMGNDAALACLSEKPRLVYDYFRQLFAQVTNPPIDPIRESVVMSLQCYVGPSGNLLEIEQSQCRRLCLPTPILTLEEFNAIKNINVVHPDWNVESIDITFPKNGSYVNAIDRICQEASDAVDNNKQIIVLSDRAVSAERVPIASLMAVGAVHHHLVQAKKRSRVAIVVESGDAREVHHMCMLLCYGVDAICPYLAIESIIKLHHQNALKPGVPVEKAVDNFKHSINGGIMKVMSKIGISTLQSYKGAQICEILGLDNDVVDKCFAGTASRIRGVSFDYISRDALALHERGFPTKYTISSKGLPDMGDFHYRDGGEEHVNHPKAIAQLQYAVRNRNDAAYQEFARIHQEQIRKCTLRGMLDFDYSGEGIPIEQVEPWTEIVRRFCTGAMSYGSISMESHSAMAIAMNRLGGKSNTGEGGEDPARSQRLPNGDTMRSAIKQIASGRFGVTSYYLSDADELQIKMAQGAKPGEGGELPGYKVSESIARTRHSTPGVGLISPPPHHDIYSIEDLKQLIYDLKASNPRARVSVKLVSEVGVGIVASGVAKAKADHILVSGHDGGTGASRWTGIKYAGLPWELGVAETHQTLVLNDLRGRVVIQTDGQLRTGRDVAIACLLGAEEWGFATTPLIALGCVMMRKCHLNTCPVGIATQDPELRKKFTGLPDHVVNFFYYVAEELRSIMAKLGFRTINEMVGRSDKLKVADHVINEKSKKLDLSPLLTPAFTLRPGAATYNVRKQDHRLYTRLDNKLIDEAELTLEDGIPSVIDCEIINTDRALGATLSNRISKRFGEEGLPTDSVRVNVFGSAGQSFGAFLAPGVTLQLEGDCNDYVGKGLSGGRLIVYPPKVSSFKSEENIIVGNTCLYGATSGIAFIRGVAAERFGVRNSGATAVVEGCGDHGCEYMTGGRVVILGSTGRNFAAGMSGGIAYVYDLQQDFAKKVNMEMVELCQVTDPAEIAFLRGLILDHRHYTGSEVADRILNDFLRNLPRFVKVLPRDYKAVLEREAAKKAEAKRLQYPKAFMPGNPIREQLEKNSKDEPAVADVEDVVGGAKTEQRLDKLRGFMKYQRRSEKYRNPVKRTNDWKEVSQRLREGELRLQTARCMDCGTPFCQSDYGCPISNKIFTWNDLVFKQQWKEAWNELSKTNNFPDITGRVCPAPCEGACTLGITDAPVGIKSVERAIFDKAWEEGWVVPNPPKYRTDKHIAIVGSGPAGLAAADQLNKAGHNVTVLERDSAPGGLLHYGIPNMKLDKLILKARIDLMTQEGITFETNAKVGPDGLYTIEELSEKYDAVILATGSTVPRDLQIPNRDAAGIHFAMEFLHKNTESLEKSNLLDGNYINAKGKDVIVIGGGDTGNDCLGTSVRHGAKSIKNLELLPIPPRERADDNPWPQYPRVFRVDYGHAEVQAHYGSDPREYSILTKSFEKDEEGNVKGINTVRIEWVKNSKGRWIMKEIRNSEEFFPADLVILALGFLGPDEEATSGTDIEKDGRSNIKTVERSYRTSLPNVYAAGDCHRGQSLVVWAIQEGRQCAREVDGALTGKTYLPGNGGVVQSTVLQN
ncbi:glutamate synthase Glt1 [Schizosaccharomyces japonicus yFS275]|uniref:Glutamate synthase [NADH] n=1 Tax=Schizosaccharomyces japonicus (strain yFS275 / FY16936) TaxID=402676 RepID=B6K5S8_SCHJY|nr:glutamate synthase Glt1 [Schizosaccharomyces japonicus yFS275]EEB08882.1 glutamate synthase Glt1 [Schizosaccharomyces japonicus yFS275]